MYVTSTAIISHTFDFLSPSVEALVWSNEGVLVEGNIGTPCGIIPAAVSAQGSWGLQHGGDSNFYESILRHVRHVQFIDEVIYRAWSRDKTLYSD